MATVAFVAIVAGLVTVLSVSLLISPVVGAAADLDEVDLALGSAAVTRSAVAQATIFAVGNANGTATPEASAAAFTRRNPIIFPGYSENRYQDREFATMAPSSIRIRRFARPPISGSCVTTSSVRPSALSASNV